MKLWTEFYRPSTIDGYVYKDDKQQQQISEWLDNKSIPHLLLSGSPGVGKTTLARILLNAIADSGDILEINASHENNVDTVREKITRFVSTRPNGEFKYVLLDEADAMSPQAQMILRNLVETYSGTNRFILTCNLPHKIIPALHSRCQGFHIDKLDKEEFTLRANTVLEQEGVEYELDDLVNYVEKTYPDMRKCLNLLQQNTVKNKLLTPSDESSATQEWMLEVIVLFEEGKVFEARTKIVQNIRPEEYEDFYRTLYRNLNWFAETQDQQDTAIIIIKEHLVSHTMCADSEINLSSCLIQLSRLKG